MLGVVPYLLLYFFLSYSSVAILGAGSYFLGRWFRRVRPSWAPAVDCVLSVLSLVVFSGMIILVVPFCLAGAYAERKNEGGKKHFFVYFDQLLSSTTLVQALLFAVALTAESLHPSALSSLFSLVELHFKSTMPFRPDLGLFALIGGYVFAAIATPSVIAIFRWMLASSKLRPGIDRHFYMGEEAPREVAGNDSNGG